MILVDANLLVYAYVTSDARHAAARSWLDGVLSGPNPVGLPWESLNAFVRIVTNPRFFSRPSTVVEAYQQVRRWLTVGNTWVPVPADHHADLLGDLLDTPDLQPGDIHDAHLVALAISHGLRIASHDSGFARFPTARWFDPLTA